MMQKRLVAWMCVFLLGALLSACQPPAEAIERAVAQTVTAYERTRESARESECACPPTALPAQGGATQAAEPPAAAQSTPAPAGTATVEAVASAPTLPPTEATPTLPEVIGTPAAPGTLGADGVYTFVDGSGGDIFSAKDGVMIESWPDKNGGGHNNTQFERDHRTLMQFELSPIPANATLLDATLYLYHSYEPEDGIVATVTIYSLSAANAGWHAGVQDLDPAAAGEFCWNALASDGAGGVLIPWAGSPGASTPGVDFEPDPIATFEFDENTPLGAEIAVPLKLERVQGWLGAPNTNYGMIFFSSTNSGHVAQSDHPKPELRPKLVVRYRLD